MNNNVTPFFSLFHDDKPFYIERSQDLNTITLFSYTPRHYLWQNKHIEHKIVFQKQDDTWFPTNITMEFFLGLRKHLPPDFTTDNLEQDFFYFVNTCLTKPNQNAYTIPRYADKNIEAVIDFIKTHPDEAQYVFNDPQWFDDYSDSLEHYCKAILNDSGRPDFITTVTHFNIDERLIAPYEQEQLKCWTFLDSQIFEGFSITTKIQKDGTPLIFAMDSEGIPSIIKNITGLAYFIAANQQIHADEESETFIHEFNKNIIDSLELYHSFMADHGIDSDPEHIYRDNNGKLKLDKFGMIELPDNSDYYFVYEEDEEPPYWIYEDFCPVPL